MLFLSVFLPACADQKTVQKTEFIMGTDITITVVARNAEQGEAAIELGMAELRRLDAMLSRFKESSEVARINRNAGMKPARVSPELLNVVERATAVSKLSGGIFDITIGPLVVLWQSRMKEGKIPSNDEINTVLPLVNYRNIIIEQKASTVFLKKKGMIIDLGGMKGYGADRVADLYKSRGIHNALIAVAGDIRALGVREDGSPWKIGVQHPRDPGKMLTILKLTDKCISTSGDYERFVIKDNKRYHHIIDPRTGRPSTGVTSVTLIGETGSFVDPLAKIPFILGPEKGLELIKKFGIEAIIVDDAGAITTTAGIKL